MAKKGDVNRATALLSSNLRPWSSVVSYHFAQSVPSYINGVASNYFDAHCNPISYGSASFSSFTSAEETWTLSVFGSIADFANMKFINQANENADLVFSALAPQAYGK